MRLFVLLLFVAATLGLPGCSSEEETFVPQNLEQPMSEDGNADETLEEVEPPPALP